MIGTNFRRIIRSGFVNFWRNSFVSLASIIVMIVTLFVLGSLLFLGVLLDTTLTQVKNKVDINVYFVPTAEEEDVLSLRDRIRELPEVADVEYVPRDEVFTRFQARHQNDQLTLQSLEELGENPFGATLNIRAGETEQYEGIAKFLEGETALGGETLIIDSVNYLENKAAIDNLGKIITASERFGFVLILVLAIATIIITFNTIYLAIYTAREEISVMRLVGASNTYIRGPFVFEGMMYGFIAGLVTLLLFYPLTFWLGPATESFFGGETNLYNYYVGDLLKISAIIMGTGVLLGGLASYLAVRKYLKI